MCHVKAGVFLYCCVPQNQLQQHFHPSVVFFVSKLFSHQRIDYLGDPLHDFTTMSFLERFMYGLIYL